MSEIKWKKVNVPDLSLAASELKDETFGKTLTNVSRISVENSEITIPDPRAFRSMSRASLLLANLCADAKSIIDPYLAQSPFCVGIYCAVENGPIDAPSTAKIIAGEEVKFAELYRKLRTPKMYLKQLPNLVPAQLGIFLGIQGVLNVYTHSKAGSLQALEQAEEDLWHDRVKLALVCSSHAFDDFLVVARTAKGEKRVITEGAGAMLLSKSGSKTAWKQLAVSDEKFYFGISDQIVNLVRRS
ncbi:MAG TPA: hypothetical protein VNJ01_03550 [Bacteriovoracaceae bacterium]|nr:hypothetical protein [Bacteriovoracaceae bacterium]